MNKERAKRALEIIDYAFCPRGVGHTHAALHGVLNTSNSVLIVANNKQGRDLAARSTSDLHYIPLDSLPDAIRGMGKAVVFDNLALQMLMRDVSDYIRELEDQQEAK